MSKLIENPKTYSGRELENIFFRPMLTGPDALDLGIKVMYNMPVPTTLNFWRRSGDILQPYGTGWTGSTAADRYQKSIEMSKVKAEIGYSAADYFSMVFEKITNSADVNLGDLTGTELEKAETELNPQYERGTLAEVYALIDKDLQEGLPLINDAIYSVPKYHFNQKAAYTFASRFYLFYGEFEKAIECADVVLGSAPAEMLRDYVALKALPRNEEVVPVQYNSTENKNNLLVHTGYSSLGIYIGPYYTGKRHTHGHALMVTELLNFAPWGEEEATMKATGTYNMYKLQPYKYAATNLDFVMFPRINFLFEYTDPVAQIGYRRTNLAVLTTDEALLNRAEAKILLEDYDGALADINLWTNNTLDGKAKKNLTARDIDDWANGLDYYTSLKPTPKKRLNPLLVDVEEGTKFEAFLHAILYIRRVEFPHRGMRWFDVKRYGIEITRRTLSTT